MSELMVEVTRSGLVECEHWGDIAVVDGRGGLTHQLGNPDKRTYFRSAAKPLQAMAVMLSGAADRFGFTGEELAVMCASHYGEPHHRRAITSILGKIGLGPDALRCGLTRPLDPEYAFRLAWDRVPLDTLCSDCSGKHAGLLAVCVQLGHDPSAYTAPDHPVQEMVLEIVAAMCGVDSADVGVGVDGCSVPVFALPLSAMARGYARLADPSDLHPAWAAAARRIWAAMTSHPEMIAGTGGFCSELIRSFGGRLIGKLGAEGVYCLALADPPLGMALKIADGATRAVSPAALGLLDRLGILGPAERATLADFLERPNRNDLGETVGIVRPAFRLVPGQHE